MKILTLLTLLIVASITLCANPYSPERSPMLPTFGFDADNGYTSDIWYSHTGGQNVFSDSTGRYLSIELSNNTYGDAYTFIRSQYPFAITASVDYRTSGYPTFGGTITIQSRTLTNNYTTSVFLPEGSIRLGNGLPFTHYVTAPGTYNVNWTFRNPNGSTSLVGKLESPHYVPILPANTVWVQRTVIGDYVCVSQASWVGGGSITLQAFKRVENWPVVTPAPVYLVNVPYSPWNSIPQTKSWFIPVNPDGTYPYIAYEASLMGGWVEGDPHYPTIETARDGVYTVNVYIE